MRAVRRDIKAPVLPSLFPALKFFKMNIRQAILSHRGQNYTADLDQPLDISIPLREGPGQPNCFWAPPMETSPVVAGDFIGSTEKGGPLNFLNVTLNPHGNGTHTECVGHIATEKFTINQCLKKFHFFAKLVTLYPFKQPNGDRVILPEQIEEIIQPNEAEALILRTMPNDEHKLTTNYSGSNPPYLHPRSVEYMVECGIEHLLLDLPSVDREEDGGKLLSHRAFWKYGGKLDDVRQNCTITEMIFAPNQIQDGLFLLNLQIASFEIDVSPSKPILYELRETTHDRSADGA
jgi:kynurenine formamidase